MRNSLNAQRAGLADRVRLIEAPSYEALPSLLKERAKLDFAFIDGMHTFDYALLDFFYVDKLLSPGGYVAFDDLWMPAIRKVIAFVLRNRSYELVKLEARSSFQQQTGTILRRFLQNPFEQHTSAIKLIPENICLLRKLSNDKRKWDFHRSF
jgi:predicted O-methyltransferase YrrM